MYTGGEVSREEALKAFLKFVAYSDAMTRLVRSPTALLIATVLVTFVAMPVAVLSGPTPAPGEVALVIAPPWSSSGGAAGVVAAAGGREVGPMRAPFAVLAVFEVQQSAQSSGAWLILDGRMMAALCGVTREDLLGSG